MVIGTIRPKLSYNKLEKEFQDDEFTKIEYLDKFIFNINNEIVSKHLLKLREPIIEKYKTDALRIKSELEDCITFVEEMFSQKVCKSLLQSL